MELSTLYYSGVKDEEKNAHLVVRKKPKRWVSPQVFNAIFATHVGTVSEIIEDL
jgi:hypothetical protein